MAVYPTSIMLYGVIIPEAYQLEREEIEEIEGIVDSFNLEVDANYNDDRETLSVAIGVYGKDRWDDGEGSPVFALTLEDIEGMKKEFDENYTPELLSLLVEKLTQYGDYDTLQLSMHLTNNRHLISVGYLGDWEENLSFSLKNF